MITSADGTSKAVTTRRAFIRGGLLLIGTGLLAACAPSPPATKEAPKPTEAPKPAAAADPKPATQATPGIATAKAPANKDTLTIAQGGDVSKFDPQLSTLVNDLSVSFNLYDNLLSRDPDLKLGPGVATEWKAATDTRWEFTLRPNVKFHNGDPLTSADVKFTIERTRDPASKTSVPTVFDTVAGIETPSDTSVVFVTKQPDPLLPARLAFFGGQILPKKYFEQVGADAFNQKPIGSGPVKFVEWIKDDHLTVERFDDYWGGPIDVKRVIFKGIPEPAARIAALLSGEADIATKIPPDHVARVNSSGGARVEGALYSGIYCLYTNSTVPPLDNPKLKQALSLAIDRETIIKTLWQNQGIIPNGFVAKGDTIGYDEKRPPFEYNMDKAKARLAESGYNNEPIYLQTTEGYLANDRQMSEVVVDSWKKIGVNIQMEIIEFSVRAALGRDKAYKGLWWGDPTSTVQDPDGMIWRILGPGGSADYWKDPEFTRLGTEAHVSMDTKLREENYAKIQQLMDIHLPWIPVIQPIESYGVQNYVSWRPSSNQQLQLRKEILKINR